MATHKNTEDDWHLSDDILKETMDAIIDRVHVSRNYDIPYVAGYSVDGQNIYIDRDMPKEFKTKDGQTVAIDKFLILHEAIEKSLLDNLKIKYQHAHQIALHAEQDAVTASGISWDEYNDFMEKQIKVIGDKKLVKLPRDLDLTPYKDEKDYDLLNKMVTKIANESYIRYALLKRD